MNPKIKNQFGFELTAIWGSQAKVSRGKLIGIENAEA
jgi:hypothetical protein